jgi:hypothetical protein
VIAPASVRDVKVKGKDKPVRATWVRTGSVGESTEGSLVRAVGVITQGPIDDLPFGHKLFIDDGSGAITVYVNLATNVDVQPLAVGQLIEVTGFSSRFTDHYEIDIRGPQDLAQPVKEPDAPGTPVWAASRRVPPRGCRCCTSRGEGEAAVGRRHHAVVTTP